jgi:serine/threonine protein kinase
MQVEQEFHHFLSSGSYSYVPLKILVVTKRHIIQRVLRRYHSIPSLSSSPISQRPRENENQPSTSPSSNLRTFIAKSLRLDLHAASSSFPSLCSTTPRGGIIQRDSQQTDRTVEFEEMMESLRDEFFIFNHLRGIQGIVPSVELHEVDGKPSLIFEDIHHRNYNNIEREGGIEEKDYESLLDFLQKRQQQLLKEMTSSLSLLSPSPSSSVLELPTSSSFSPPPSPSSLIGVGVGVETALSIGLSVANTLQKVHERGVIHYDVKPRNLLYHPSTQTATLIDFGSAAFSAIDSSSLLAPFSSSSRPVLSLRQRLPGTMRGTPSYMSPEQTGRMNREVDCRADIYCLGVTMYQLLVGELPFTGRDRLELVHCHLARPVPHFAKRMATLDGLANNPPGSQGQSFGDRGAAGGGEEERSLSSWKTLERLVEKTMAKNPEDRYQSAGGLAHDLRALLSQWRVFGRLDPDFSLASKDVGLFPSRFFIVLSSDFFLSLIRFFFFSLAKVGWKFQVAQKLYGREKEIESLFHAFERAVETRSGSPTRVVVISGGSGVGKTSLVLELLKPMVK